MLLTELRTKEEKAAFLSLAHTVAAADSCIGTAQHLLINMYQAEMAIDSQQPLQYKSIADACRAFKDPYTKKIALMNLFYLAYADGYINNKQKSVLDSIRLELNVDSAEVAKCEEEMAIINNRFYWD